MADLSAAFVRLYGMLYDRINLEQYDEVATVAFGCLARTLGGWVPEQPGHGKDGAGWVP